jgi:hypothetical protein
MGLFRRSKHAARTSRKPTWRERRAAGRTAQAKASPVETEQKIHQIAHDVRNDLRGSALLSRVLLSRSLYCPARLRPPLQALPSLVGPGRAGGLWLAGEGAS